jgi:hypothetical protein
MDEDAGECGLRGLELPLPLGRGLSRLLSPPNALDTFELVLLVLLCVCTWWMDRMELTEEDVLLRPRSPAEERRKEECGVSGAGLRLWRGVNVAVVVMAWGRTRGVVNGGVDSGDRSRCRPCWSAGLPTPPDAVRLGVPTPWPCPLPPPPDALPGVPPGRPDFVVFGDLFDGSRLFGRSLAVLLLCGERARFGSSTIQCFSVENRNVTFRLPLLRGTITS